MRVSTANIFESGSAAISRNQVELLSTQQKLASGRRILSAADDPIAAAEALRARQAIGRNDQFSANQKAALASLRQLDSTLGEVASLLQDVRVLVVSAGNATLQDSDRRSLARELGGRLDELLSLANTENGNGSYLFGGYSDTAAPFARSGRSVAYGGDQGSRALQVTETRALAVTANGAETFERIGRGNGTFVASADAANRGSGVIETGEVTNAGALTGHGYRIAFERSGSAATYTVTDTTSGATVLARVPFAGGESIGFAGIRVAINGEPAQGDSFTISPAGTQSVFATLQDLIDALEKPASSAAGRAALGNALMGGIANVDNALDRVLSVRTGVGARMQEVEGLQEASANRAVELKQVLSQLEDIDYAQAASELSQRQLVLQAAQQSFVRVSALSLFDYL